MKMRILLLALLLIVGKVKSQEIEESRFAEDAPKIDGVFNDWHREMRFFDTNAKMSYDMGNDKENLYLVFQATDFTVQRLMAGGLTVSINATGKKRQGATLQYPASYNFFKGDTTHHLRQIESATNQMEGHHFPRKFRITGFAQMQDGFLDADSSTQIRLASAMVANKDYTVEMAIPLKNLGITLPSKKAIAMNISFTADRSNRDERMPNHGMQGGGRGMQGGMGRGSMMGGGMRGMGNGAGVPRNGFADYNTLKTNFWVKFVLAGAEDQ